MFTLWYSILGYKEYKSISQKCSVSNSDTKIGLNNGNNKCNITSPTPKSTPSQVPTPKPPPPPPNPNKTTVESGPPQPRVTQTAPQKKIARSPSPHPIRSYDLLSNEDSEEYSEEYDEDDDYIDEDSVIDSTTYKNKLQDTTMNDPRNSIKNFINLEKNSTQNERYFNN